MAQGEVKETINIGSKADTRGFKKAETAANKLNKTVKNLAATFGVAYSTAAIVNFGKASVKAFLEAEKANVRLANVVDNLGLSFATAGIQKNLDDISAKAGIAGEVLVDAFQPLLTTTGSVIKSQELLALALDVSAGSGVDLTTVTQDLALAYTGVTKGLKKYNLGLTQAELKTTDFNKVQGLLNKQFSGANSKYLATYAGKMQVLAEAAGNSQEIIGQGLLDALSAIGGDTSIEDLANDMKGLATYVADVTRGIGNLGKAFKLNGLTSDASGNFDPTALIQAIPILGSYINMLRESGATKQSTGFSFFGSPMEATQKKRDAAAAKKAEADAAKRAKELAKVTKANTAELKKQALAKKQSALFDMEQIQIIAALKGNISKEEELRLKLQLALITGNEDQAKKLSDQLADSIDKTGKLKLYINTLPEAPNPFKNWDTFLDGVIAKARLAASIGGSGGVVVPPSSNGAGLDFGGNKIGTPVPNFTPPSSGTYGAAVPPVVVQIDGKTIASALMDQSLSGNQAYVNRRTGGFE